MTRFEEWITTLFWVAVAAFVAAAVMMLAISGCGDPCDSRPNYDHPRPAPDRAEPIIDGREDTRLAINGSSKFKVQSSKQGAVAAVLAAIRQEESSGLAAPKDGDGGRAIGPYQIHEAYWLDSREVGRYADCRGESYARRVVVAYFRRYAPGALARGDSETLARVHNGGPHGAAKASTRDYWRRVQRHLSATKEG